MCPDNDEYFYDNWCLCNCGCRERAMQIRIEATTEKLIRIIEEQLKADSAGHHLRKVAGIEPVFVRECRAV